MARDTLSRRFARLLPLAGGLLAAFGTATSASARRVEAGQAPPAWIAYAQVVSDVVQTRLTADDPVALRLRDYLNQLPGAGESTGAVLKIAFWIDGKGRIARIDHAPFAQTEPNDDLRALLVGLTLSRSPPKGMLLPLRLSIQIKPKSQDTTPRSASAPTAMTIGLRYRVSPTRPRAS